jgi:O-succinylbenzoic acid--CoA ligase
MAKIHQSFKINGFSYNEFLNQRFENERLKEFQNELLNFKTANKFVFQTSGTTGRSKQIVFSIDKVKISAIGTHAIFSLFEGAVVLNALPLQYVASKMMLYRSLICGYSLYVLDPSFDEGIFDDLPDAVDFVPLVPLQVERLLSFKNRPFQFIHKVLIGGASVSSGLRSNILDLDVRTKFYESFGSTETLTHIAVKEISKLDSDFKAIEGVHFSEQKNCLVIHAPHVNDYPIVTNDLVDLISSKTFKWKGRVDNVINSGGIKIIPEQLEMKISTLINNPFFIASVPSENLGQQVILVIESSTNYEIDFSNSALGKYETPKKVYFIPKFYRTESGKILRKKCLVDIHI